MRRLILTALVVPLLVACDPAVDPADRPAPTGVIEGTILYAGPRPACLRDADGTVQRPLGQVVLTAFPYDNPPPPEGTSRSAASLLTLPASVLFPESGDCLPAEAQPADLTPVSRTAGFVWPNLVLGEAYQVRAFFDRDEDFVPFFSVRNQATRDDLAGGALVDATAEIPRFRRIAFGSAEARPAGQRITGVLVTVGVPVSTERPAFQPGEGSLSLSSHATLPLTDPLVWEQTLWEQTRSSLSRIDDATDGYQAALDAAGIVLTPGESWFLRAMDLDVDGQPDPHPILGAVGYPWVSPLWILERARTPEEVAAGVPGVRLIGSPRMADIMAGRVDAPGLEMLLPPIAVVTLDPADPACQVAYVPRGNLASTYEAAPAVCQELPTGVYSQSVLHGLLGADPVDGSGGRFSAQAWSIPNELGPADLLTDPDAIHQLQVEDEVAAQGPAGRQQVHDPDTEIQPECTQGLDPSVGGPRALSMVPIPEACCEAVAHLCGLPLCTPVRGEDGLVTRPAQADQGALSCMPFPLPEACCP